MRMTLLIGAVLLSAAATGCTVRTRTYAEPATVYAEPAPVYREPATVYHEPAPTYAPPPVVFHEPPPLVAVEPDVYVVHNYPEPVYYTDGYYWRFHAGVWYRAADYNAGWITVNLGTVPRRIAYRDHRHYVRYNPPRAHVVRAPTRHRATTRRYAPAPRTYVPPARTHVPPARTYRQPSTTYRTRPVTPQPQRQVVRPGYVQQRSTPARRPAYKEPVQRQRVRGRDVPPPRPRIQTPPRPQPRIQPRKEDKRRIQPNRGDSTHEHPHKHSPQKTHHH